MLGFTASYLVLKSRIFCMNDAIITVYGDSFDDSQFAELDIPIKNHCAVSVILLLFAFMEGS